MHLVIRQVGEFHHIYVAHRDRLVELFAGETVAEYYLPRRRKLRFLHSLFYILLRSAVEYRSSHLPSEYLRRPPQLRLKKLADVHTAGHAQGIEHYVQGRPVGQIRHVLIGQYLGYNALVPVPAGHFIARLEFLLAGDKARYPPQHSRRQLVAVLDPVQVPVHLGHRLLYLAVDGHYYAVHLGLELLVVIHIDVLEVRLLELAQVLSRYLHSRLYQRLARVEVFKVAYELGAYEFLVHPFRFFSFQLLQDVLVPFLDDLALF